MHQSSYWETDHCSCNGEISNLFKESGDSLPCSQDPNTGTYSKLTEPNPHPISFYVHFNITLAFMPKQSLQLYDWCKLKQWNLQPILT